MSNKYEEMDLTEVINEWQDENKAWHFEGTRGVDKLQELLGQIGYKEGNYLGYNNEIINFLSDNPGAIEAIINWIGEQNLDEWKENLVSCLPDDEDEGEEKE